MMEPPTSHRLILIQLLEYSQFQCIWTLNSAAGAAVQPRGWGQCLVGMLPQQNGGRRVARQQLQAARPGARDAARA